MMGYPVTTEGIEKFQWMVEEQDKRDQDRHNMYIYNDFSGYGTTEMIENLVSSLSALLSASLTLHKKLSDFNKILFKKDVSPFKKWAYVEALATWFKIGDLMFWMSICSSSPILRGLTLTRCSERRLRLHVRDHGHVRHHAPHILRHALRTWSLSSRLSAS